MNLGAEPKKVMILGGLLAVAGVIYFINRDDTGGPPREAQQAATPVAKAVDPVKEATKSLMPDLAKPAGPTRARSQREASQEFRPTLKAKRPEDRPDPTTIDPTLQLALLTRLKDVKLDRGSTRSLFDFSAAPVAIVKAPDPGKIKPGAKGATVAVVTPPAVPGPPPGPPPPPPAPKIPLKFYGFIENKQSRTKRALLLEGEEIFVAIEGETVKKRYKVIRIGINSVVMEDTEFKSQQTLPLEEPQAS